MYVLLFIIDLTKGVNPKRPTLKKGQSETSESETSDSETSSQKCHIPKRSQAEIFVYRMFHISDKIR